MPTSSIRTKLHKIYKAPVSRYLPYIPKQNFLFKYPPTGICLPCLICHLLCQFCPRSGAEEGVALALDCALWEQGGCCKGASLSILGPAPEAILPSSHLTSLSFSPSRPCSVHKEFSENILASYAILGGPRHQTRRTCTGLLWITASLFLTSLRWDGWMASPTQWTWVSVSSRSWCGQGSLACCSPWSRKESDTTE